MNLNPDEVICDKCNGTGYDLTVHTHEEFSPDASQKYEEFS